MQGDIKIEVGQIWREDDRRGTRFIHVTAVWKDGVTFRTCNLDGLFLPRTRFSWAKIERFGKSGGYKFTTAAPTGG